MPRKYLDQMMEEVEYANYQRWLSSHPNNVVSFPSLHSEYMNYVNTNRYDSFSRGCYVPQYWLLPQLSRNNKESFYLVKGHEQRSSYRNYHDDKYYSKGNNYYNRRGENKFDRENGGNYYSNPGRRWREFSSHYSERTNEHRPSFSGRSRYQDNEWDESCYHGNNNYRRFMHDRLEPPDFPNDLEGTNEEGGSSRCPSTASLHGSSDYKRCETQDPGTGKSRSTSEVSVHSESTEMSTQVASWYNAEEQEQIVSMLREVNLRHDMQLQRDILNNKSEHSCSDDSRNHGSLDDGQESVSSDEDDGITVILSSETVLPLPETITAEDLANDYLGESTSDCLSKALFPVSPEEIMNTLTKEYIKEDSLKKDLNPLTKEYIEEGSSLKTDNGLAKDLDTLKKENIEERSLKKDNSLAKDLNTLTVEYIEEGNSLNKNNILGNDLNASTEECLGYERKEDVSIDDGHAFNTEYLAVSSEKNSISKETTNLATKVCLKEAALGTGDSTINVSTVIDGPSNDSEVIFSPNIQPNDESVTSRRESVQTKANKERKSPSPTQTTDIRSENEIGTVSLAIRVHSLDYATNKIPKLPSPIREDNTISTANKEATVVNKIHPVSDSSLTPIETHLTISVNAAEFKPRRNLPPEYPTRLSENLNCVPENITKLKESLVSEKDNGEQLKISSNVANLAGKETNCSNSNFTSHSKSNDASPVQSNAFPIQNNDPPIQNRSPLFSNYNIGAKCGVKCSPPAFTSLRQVKPIRGHGFEAFPKPYLFPKGFDANSRLGTNRNPNIFVRQPPPSFNIVKICNPNLGFQRNEQFQLISTKLHSELNDNCKNFFWRKIPYFVQRTGIDRKQEAKSDNCLISLPPMADAVKKTSFSESHLPFKNAEVHYKRISVDELFKESLKHENTNVRQENCVKDPISGTQQSFASATDHLKHLLRIGSSSDDHNSKKELNSTNSIPQESEILPKGDLSSNLESNGSSAKKKSLPEVTANRGSSRSFNGFLNDNVRRYDNACHYENAATSSESKLHNGDTSAKVIAQSENNSERNKENKSYATSNRNEKQIKYSYSNSRKSYYQRGSKMDQPKPWNGERESMLSGKDKESSSRNNKEGSSRNKDIECSSRNNDKEGSSRNSEKEDSSRNNYKEGISRNNNKYKDKTEIKTPEVKVHEIHDVGDKMAEEKTTENRTKPKMNKKKKKNKSKANSESVQPSEVSRLDDASKSCAEEDKANALQYETRRIRGNLKKYFPQSEYSDSCFSEKEKNIFDNSCRESLTRIKNYNNSERDEDIRKNDKDKTLALKEKSEIDYGSTKETKASDINQEKKVDKNNTHFSQPRNYNNFIKDKNVEKDYGKVFKASTSKESYEIECRKTTENKATDTSEDQNFGNAEKYNTDKNRKRNTHPTVQNKETRLKLDEKDESSVEKPSTHHTKNKYDENKTVESFKERNQYETEQKTTYLSSYSNRKSSTSKYNDEQKLCSRCQKFYYDSNYYERPRNNYYRSNNDYKTQYVNDRKFRMKNKDTYDSNFTRNESTHSNYYQNKGCSKVDPLKEEIVHNQAGSSKHLVKISTSSESKLKNNGTSAKITGQCDVIYKKQDHRDNVHDTGERDKQKPADIEIDKQNTEQTYNEKVIGVPGNVKRNDEHIAMNKRHHEQNCNEKVSEEPKIVKRNDERIAIDKQHTMYNENVIGEPENVKPNDERIAIDKRHEEQMCSEKVDEESKHVKRYNKRIENDKHSHEQMCNEKVGEDPGNVKRNDERIVIDKRHYEQTRNEITGAEPDKVKRNDEHIAIDKDHTTYNEKAIGEPEDVKWNDERIAIYKRNQEQMCSEKVGEEPKHAVKQHYEQNCKEKSSADPKVTKRNDDSIAIDNQHQGKNYSEKFGEKPKEVKRNNERIENDKRSHEQICNEKVGGEPGNVKRNDERNEIDKQHFEQNCNEKVSEEPKIVKRNDERIAIDKRHQEQICIVKVEEPENTKRVEMNNERVEIDKHHEQNCNKKVVGEPENGNRNNERIENDKRHHEQIYTGKVGEEPKNIKQKEERKEIKTGPYERIEKISEGPENEKRNDEHIEINKQNLKQKHTDEICVGLGNENQNYVDTGEKDISTAAKIIVSNLVICNGNTTNAKLLGETSYENVEHSTIQKKNENDINSDPTAHHQKDIFLDVENMDQNAYIENNYKYASVNTEESSSLIREENSRICKEQSPMVATEETPMIVPEEYPKIETTESSILGTKEYFTLGTEEPSFFGEERIDVLDQNTEDYPFDGSEVGPTNNTKQYSTVCTKEYIPLVTQEHFGAKRIGRTDQDTEDYLFDGSEESSTAGSSESSIVDTKESVTLGAEEPSLFGAEESPMFNTEDYPYVSLEEYSMVDTEKCAMVGTEEFSKLGQEVSSALGIKESYIFDTDITPLICTEESFITDTKETFMIGKGDSPVVFAEESSKVAKKGSHVSELYISNLRHAGPIPVLKNNDEIKVETSDGKCPNIQEVHNVKKRKNGCKETSGLKDCKLANENLNWLEKKTSMMVKQTKMSAKDARFKVSSSSRTNPGNVFGSSKSDTCLLEMHKDNSTLKWYSNANETPKNKSFLVSNNYKVLLGKKKLRTNESVQNRSQRNDEVYQK